MDGGESSSSIEPVEISKSSEVDVVVSEGYNIDDSYDDCETDNEILNDDAEIPQDSTDRYDDCGVEGNSPKESADVSGGDECDDCEKADHRNCPIEAEGYGMWEGERGESKWVPERDYVNTDDSANPDGLTNGKIMDKYNIEGIDYKDGEPDFSDIRVGNPVEIEEYSDKRPQNFAKADIAYADANGTKPEVVKDMREKEHLTWHEHRDCKTMELVPSEVHNNKSIASHRGGISEIKEKLTNDR
jgi:hypothetical protein